MDDPTDTTAKQASEKRRYPGVGPLDEPLADLVQQLSEGSEVAAEKIATHFTPHLRRVVRASLPRELRSKVDSIDLVNTLWGAVLTNPARIADVQDPDQLMARLIQAVRNRMIDEYRKYTVCAKRSVDREAGAYQEVRDARNQTGGVAGDGRLGGREPTPSQVVIAREKYATVVGRLGAKEREVIKLRMKGLTYDEIAEAVDGVSATTARRLVSGIVDQLQG